MTRSEALTVLAGTSEEDLGDALMTMSCEYWLSKGNDKDDILFMTETTLDDLEEEDSEDDDD